MQVGVGVILRGSLTTNFEFLNTGLCWLGGGCCRYIISRDFKQNLVKMLINRLQCLFCAIVAFFVVTMEKL